MCTVHIHLALQRWMLAQSNENRKSSTTEDSFVVPSLSLLSPGSRLNICSSLFFLFSVAWEKSRLSWCIKGEANIYLKGMFVQKDLLRKKNGLEVLVPR